MDSNYSSLCGTNIASICMKKKFSRFFLQPKKTAQLFCNRSLHTQKTPAAGHIHLHNWLARDWLYEAANCRTFCRYLHGNCVRSLSRNQPARSCRQFIAMHSNAIRATSRLYEYIAVVTRGKFELRSVTSRNWNRDNDQCFIAAQYAIVLTCQPGNW